MNTNTTGLQEAALVLSHVQCAEDCSVIRDTAELALEEEALDFAAAKLRETGEKGSEVWAQTVEGLKANLRNEDE